LWSWFYGPLGKLFERRPKLMPLERAAIQPQEKVLGIAVGPEKALVKILTKIDTTNTVHGVDLSPKITDQTRRLVSTAGFSNFNLQVADARRLPLSSGTLDVLFNSYMLDLILLKDMPLVLGEFRRVLKPGGRLVLVNLSKIDSDANLWW
jgi:ubiquinone/menaquinone biosynthesis C-methylase UbiE